MSDEREDREEKGDKTIIDALSSLGWVEEKEKVEETTNSDDDYLEQLYLFKEQNKKLNEEVIRISKENEDLKREIEDLKFSLNDLIQQKESNQTNTVINEKNNVIQQLEEKIQQLSQNTEVDASQEQKIQLLYKSIENKNQNIENLKLMLKEQTEQNQDLDSLIKQKEQYLTHEQQTISKNEKIIDDQIQKIRELMEQVHYLQSDSVEKSKFEKIKILIEKKDEVITEKEKTIFNLENSLNSSNKNINEIQQQLETFSLVKKDLINKENRINELVIINEKKNQQIIINSELIKRLETRLEESQKKSGSLSTNFKVELTNIQDQLKEKDSEIKEKDSEIKTLRENVLNLKNKLKEADLIEDKILTDLQDLKTEKLKFEIEIDKKETELVELKKKIKIMRRNMDKS